MARKKKPKPFRAVTAVKAAARAHIGAPPPTRRQETDAEKKRRAKPKHKPPAGQVWEELE